MSDPYEVYAEMIETLHQAQDAVRLEMEGLGGEAPEGNSTALARLRDAIAGFDDQAHALILLMSDRDVPSDLLRIGEDLAHFFEDARRQVEAMISAAQG